MAERVDFKKQLQAKWDEGKFVCLGLDPDPNKLPPHIENKYLTLEDDSWVEFNSSIVETTKDLVCAYKTNISFYEGSGALQDALKATVELIHETAPGVPVIGDIKKGDVPHAGEHHARMAFERYKFDAVTVHPYMGSETFEPFLAYPDKEVFVVCRTSNPDSGEMQKLPVDLWEAVRARVLSQNEYHKLIGIIKDRSNTKSVPLYEMVAFLTTHRWNYSNRLGLVMGATDPYAIESIRTITSDLPLLIPAIGDQHGDLEQVIKAAPNSKGQGFLISASRSLIYASSGEDYAETARDKTLELNHQVRRMLSVYV